ncbi:anaphase-promoting complex subunit cdc27, partial [Cryomyces antarcticus]
MSPVDVHKATQLRQLTYYHLDNDLLDNAVFLAGRLHAAEPRSPDAAHLLALSYLRLKRPKAAYDYSHKHGASGRHLGCAYVFALACLDLERHPDGITALEKSRALWAGRNNW